MEPIEWKLQGDEAILPPALRWREWLQLGHQRCSVCEPESTLVFKKGNQRPLHYGPSGSTEHGVIITSPWSSSVFALVCLSAYFRPLQQSFPYTFPPNTRLHLTSVSVPRSLASCGRRWASKSNVQLSRYSRWGAMSTSSGATSFWPQFCCWRDCP